MIVSLYNVLPKYQRQSDNAQGGSGLGLVRRWERIAVRDGSVTVNCFTS